MTSPAPRDRGQRKRDTLELLARPAVDVWVASAGSSDDGLAEPHLVPLSLAWIDDRVVITLDTTSRTARNIVGSGIARLGVGPTRDVVLIDVTLERTLTVTDPAAQHIAERYAAQADWDPRSAGDGYSYLVLRPERIQAWREVDEMWGRTLMRHGSWLV